MDIPRFMNGFVKSITCSLNKIFTCISNIPTMVGVYTNTMITTLIGMIYTLEKKHKSRWKTFNPAVESKKLYFLSSLTNKKVLRSEKKYERKDYDFNGWTNFKFEKKGAFLILDCVESRLDLNRSFNRSRWVFFPKYISFLYLATFFFLKVSVSLS